MMEATGITLPAPLYTVDWASAGRDWDGVRMTLEGFARTAFVEIPALDGVTTYITDRLHERTDWLRPVLDDARSIGRVSTSS
jgi:hypothetical protein